MKKFYEVNVIDTIPALHVDFSIIKNPLEDCVKYETSHDNIRYVKSSLFDGERRKFRFGFENYILILGHELMLGCAQLRCFK